MTGSRILQPDSIISTNLNKVQCSLKSLLSHQNFVNFLYLLLILGRILVNQYMLTWQTEGLICQQKVFIRFHCSTWWTNYLAKEVETLLKRLWRLRYSKESLKSLSRQILTFNGSFIKPMQRVRQVTKLYKNHCKLPGNSKSKASISLDDINTVTGVYCR